MIVGTSVIIVHAPILTLPHVQSCKSEVTLPTLPCTPYTNSKTNAAAATNAVIVYIVCLVNARTDRKAQIVRNISLPEIGSLPTTPSFVNDSTESVST